MRLNIAVSLLVVLGCVSGCSLDEVLSLDVNKKESVCPDVKALQLYEYAEDGSVLSRSYCSADQKCAQTNNDYRGALKYGICPEDVPFCLEGDIGKYCGACREGYVVCGRDVNNSVKCIDPKTDKEHCGARGTCMGDDPSSVNYGGTLCPEHHSCVDGKCELDGGYCDEKTSYPKCDGNTAVTCNADGMEKTEDCITKAEETVCEAGRCVRPKCEALGIKDKSCSADGKTYYTCEDGRVHKEICNADVTCTEGVGCKVECSQNACYQEAGKESILRRCNDGKLSDEACPSDMYCQGDQNGARCVCNKGDVKCGTKQAGDVGVGKIGDLGVRKCEVGGDGNFSWSFIDICESDFPLCEKGKCVQDKHDIGAPCQIVVKGDKGEDLVCVGDNADNPLCTVRLTGKDVHNYLNKEKIQGSGQLLGEDWNNVVNTLNQMKDFLVYVNNIFPKDESVIRGCEDVVVPEGMQLGCMTSEAIIYSIKDPVSVELSKFAWAYLFSASPLIRRMFEKYFNNMLSQGVQFTAPNGYCVVGAYDATMSGYSFNNFFMTVSDEKTVAVGFHNQDKPKKIEGGADMVSSKTRHPVAAKVVQAGKCPAGSVGFSLTEPLIYGTSNRSVDGKDMDVVDYVIRIGTDVCLKACSDVEHSSDCREGYKCMKIPTVAPCAYEEVQDVIARGEYKTACIAEETYNAVVKARNLAHFGEDEAERPTKESEHCRDGLCCGSLERDWKTENVSCDRIFEGGEAVCIH